jgi:peptidoglycan/LPS O-acetylase OafA/YrhL
MVLASLVLAVWLRGRARLNDQSDLLNRLPTAFDLAERRMRAFAVVVIAGVVANAVVCAALASSLDRFQARVIWLLPFLALSMLAVARQARLCDAGISALRHSTSPPNLSIQGSTP